MAFALHGRVLTYTCRCIEKLSTHPGVTVRGGGGGGGGHPGQAASPSQCRGAGTSSIPSQIVGDASCSDVWSLGINKLPSSSHGQCTNLKTSSQRLFFCLSQPCCLQQVLLDNSK